jgi:hypothetical protein
VSSWSGAIPSAANNKRTLPPLDFAPTKRPKFHEVAQRSDHGPQSAFYQDDTQYWALVEAQEQSNNILPYYELERSLSTELSWSNRHPVEVAEIGAVSIHRAAVWEHHPAENVIPNDYRVERADLFQERAQPVLQDHVNWSSPSPCIVSSTSQTSSCHQDQVNCEEGLGDDRFEGEEGFSEKVCYGMVSPANQQTSKGSH